MRVAEDLPGATALGSVCRLSFTFVRNFRYDCVLRMLNVERRTKILELLENKHFFAQTFQNENAKLSQL